MHIPGPHRRVIRYYGAYSSVIRARRRRQAPARADAQQPRTTPPTTVPADTERRALRRRWVELITRIYEVDPLACPRCGAAMRIIAFITEPRVIQKILRRLATTPADERSPPHDDSAVA